MNYLLIKSISPSKFNIFCFLIIFTSWLPSFGSIDKMASQWFLLSILSLIGFLYIFFTQKKIIFYNNNLIFNSYFIFVILASFSLVYSLNFIISIVDLSRIFIIFSLLLILLNLSEKDIFNNVAFLLSILLLTEIFYSNIVFITSFFSGQYLEYLSPSYFVGIAANKNITAASLCIKTPFLLYSIFISKRVNPILGFIFLFFLFFAITVISARASFLSLFVLLSVLLFYTFYYRIKKWAQLLLYVFIPFISAILLNIYLTFEVNNNFISRVSSIEFSEESSNGRYELWKNALDYISINPIIGCGLGNWKIQSLPYWKDILFDYTVPYHAHNDFLELTTELGIFGGLSYLSIFIISSYFLFKHSLSNKNDFISVVVLSSFFVYFIDAFFNFPLERPLMQIVFLFLLFFVINLKTTNEKHL